MRPGEPAALRAASHAFRRQYFTSQRSLQGSLDRFLQFYNHERTHRGYRLRGRTPATVFHGAVAA